MTKLSGVEPELVFLTIKVNLLHTRPIFVVNLYRAPDTNIDETFRRLYLLMNQITDQHRTPELYMMEDLNVNCKVMRSPGSARLRTFC